MPRVKKIVLLLSMLCSVAVGAVICFFILSAFNKIDTNIDISIAIENRTEVYSGSPIYANNYSITSGKLSKGDYLDVEYIGSQTNVGKAISSANVRVYNEAGYDVSKDYKINVKSGIIEITKQTLVLKCKSSVVYKPNFIDEASFEILSGSIGLKERIIPTLDDEYKRGNSEVKLKASIYDYYGNDVSDNYNITITNKLVIDKIPLLVMSGSATKVYDGQELFDIGYYTSGLLSGDYLDTSSIRSSKSYTTITNVSESGAVNQIDIEKLIVKDANNNVVTNSYTIIKQEIGRLYITAKDIVITTSSYQTTYSDQNIDSQTQNWTCSYDTFYANYKDKASMSSFDTAGTYLNTITFSNAQGLDNYNITYNYGIVSISKLVVNVYLPTIYGTTSSSESDLMGQISQSDIKISSPEAAEIPSLLVIEIPNYDFQTMGQGTYSYSAQLLEPLDNFDIIIHPGNIIINN